MGRQTLEQKYKYTKVWLKSIYVLETTKADLQKPINFCRLFLVKTVNSVKLCSDVVSYSR